MAQRHPHDDPEAREANRLYWESDLSVNAVAETLGVSKGRLYDLVAPLPVDVSCPDCGGELAFPNRTARDRGLLTCDTCGFEGDRDELEALYGTGSKAAGSREDDPFREGSGETGGTRTPASLLGQPVMGRPVILGGLLVGVVGGVLLARWLRD
jgi:hypothetical protein